MNCYYKERNGQVGCPGTHPEWVVWVPASVTRRRLIVDYPSRVLGTEDPPHAGAGASSGSARAERWRAQPLRRGPAEYSQCISLREQHHGR